MIDGEVRVLVSGGSEGSWDGASITTSKQCRNSSRRKSACLFATLAFSLSVLHVELSLAGLPSQGAVHQAPPKLLLHGHRPLAPSARNSGGNSMQEPKLGRPVAAFERLSRQVGAHDAAGKLIKLRAAARGGIMSSVVGARSLLWLTNNEASLASQPVVDGARRLRMAYQAIRDG